MVKLVKSKKKCGLGAPVSPTAPIRSLQNQPHLGCIAQSIARLNIAILISVKFRADLRRDGNTIVFIYSQPYIQRNLTFWSVMKMGLHEPTKL